jgi:hypothetical protein
MAFPITKIEIAFNDGPYVASPTWTDVTTDVRSLSVKRGRSDDYSQFPTGSATVVLSNRTEKYNPLNTAGVYYGKLLPRRQIRIQAKVNALSGYQDVWRGYISGWPVSWTQAGLDSTVTIQCFDMLGLLADTQFAADWSYPTITTGMTGAGPPTCYYRLQEPVGLTSFIDTMHPPETFGSRYAMTQSSGSFSYLKTNSLTPGLPAGGTNFQPANSWSAFGDNTGGSSLGACAISLWWRASRSGVQSTPFVLDNKLVQLEGVVTSAGALRVRAYGASSRQQCTSTLETLNDGEAHHIFVQTGALGSGEFWIFIDGQSCAGSVTSSGSGSTFSSTIQKLTLSDDIISEVAYWAKNQGSVPFLFAFGPTTAEVKSLYASAKPYFIETTGARTTRIMQTTSIPAALYNVTTTPVNTVADINVGGLLVAELQKTSDSEGGEMFVDRAGVLQFTDQWYSTTQGGTTDVITFSDSPGNNPYGQDLDVHYTADDIANDVIVTFSEGGNVRTTSSTSQTSSGVASTTIDTYLSSVTGATDLAYYELQVRSPLKPQVSAIEASVARTETQWYDILNLELLSPFTITRTPPAGTVFTQKMIVNSISHDISPSGWRTSIQGSARYTGWFVLDYSALDGPDLLL